MTKTNALPRPVGATALALLAIAVAALALPVPSLAAPEGEEGSPPAPQLAFTPASHDFGIQRAYNGTSTYLQLTNGGEVAVQVGNFEIAGGSGAFGTGNTDCLSHWLQPGETCSVQVYFNPYDAVVYEAELRAWVGGSSFTATLSGAGGRAVVGPAANPVEFGAVAVGAAGEARAISLTNTGNLPASFFIAVIASGSVASFQLLDEDCTAAPLDPGGSCTAYVRFAPQGTGAKSARLALFGDGDAGTMVMLTGEGVAAPAPAASQATTAAPPPPADRGQGRHRRFERGAMLAAGRAHCHTAKACRKAKALRARTVVAG